VADKSFGELHYYLSGWDDVLYDLNIR